MSPKSTRLEQIREVYRAEAQTKELALTAHQRLLHHQTHSQPVMDKLHGWMSQAGAPLDNNVCERALKMAILHRKNSLSYKTLNGAQTGDLFMSLIHTCRLNGVSPFEYLLAIATRPEAKTFDPQNWMPWNYPKAATTSDSS